MDNEKILEDFFRSFKVTLTNSFSYSKNHPYFIKSVESFKSKLESTLIVLNPLKIGVTNLWLVVDGKNLTKAGFYDELARLLHQRKIKSIEIRNGASIQELVQFFSVISLPQKEIFKCGGVNAILGKEKLIHITIDELDYSVFLQGEGEECTDIWGYMLKEAVYSNDTVKLGQLADGFGSLIKRVNEKDLFDAEGISPEVNEFLVYLRGKDKVKFDKCSKDVFLWLLRNKKTLSQENLEKLKPVFNGLSREDLNLLLQDGFLEEDNFDSLSLQLFSKISGQDNPLKITENFFNKIHETQGLKNNPGVEKKIRNLLSSSQDDRMSAVYRNTLNSLVKNISFSGKLFFDHRALKENYRYIVLGILSVDKNSDTLHTTAAILEKELANIFEDNDVGFLKDLWNVLAKRKKEDIDACIDLEKKFSVFIENIVLSVSLPAEQEFLLEMISFPAKELNFYLDKLFSTEKVNKQILALYLRLFPDSLDVFYKRLAQRIQDMEFLASLIDLLVQLDAPATLSILEYVYSFANELVKSESLKAMRKLKKVDAVFLKRQLNTDSLPLRRGLFSVLVLDAQAKNNVLDLLFKVSSFLGSRNKFLIENMQIASDLRFIEATKRIKDLSRRKFFWNKELRNKAKQILKEWNVL